MVCDPVSPFYRGLNLNQSGHYSPNSLKRSTSTSDTRWTKCHHPDSLNPAPWPGVTITITSLTLIVLWLSLFLSHGHRISTASGLVFLSTWLFCTSMWVIFQLDCFFQLAIYIYVQRKRFHVLWISYYEGRVYRILPPIFSGPITCSTCLYILEAKLFFTFMCLIAKLTYLTFAALKVLGE